MGRHSASGFLLLGPLFGGHPHVLTSVLRGDGTIHGGQLDGGTDGWQDWRGCQVIEHGLVHVGDGHIVVSSHVSPVSIRSDGLGVSIHRHSLHEATGLGILFDEITPILTVSRGKTDCPTT